MVGILPCRGDNGNGSVLVDDIHVLNLQVFGFGVVLGDAVSVHP
jgi:hypothetical protein